MLNFYFITLIYSMILLFLFSLIIWLVLSRHLLINKIWSLIGVFVVLAGILLLKNLEFLALIILLVYVGAIAVLFLFVVMIVNPDFLVVLLEQKNLSESATVKKDEEKTNNSEIVETDSEVTTSSYVNTFFLGFFLSFFLAVHLEAKSSFKILIISPQKYYSIFSDLGNNFTESFFYYSWNFFNTSYHPNVYENKELINIGTFLYLKYGIALLIIGVMLLVSMMAAITLTLRTTGLLKRQEVGNQMERYVNHNRK